MSRTLAAALVFSIAISTVATGQEPPGTPISIGQLFLRDDSAAAGDPARRYVKVKSRTGLDPIPNQIVMPIPGSAGDPTPAGATGGGAALTVYNVATGETATLDLPATYWRGTPKSYIYKERVGPTIIKAYVRAQRLYVRGGGTGWSYTLDEPAQGALAVRVRLGTGVEWCGQGAPRVPVEQYDVVGKFWSAKNPAPATCAPPPGG